MYLVFSTEQEAQESYKKLFNNIRDWLKENYPMRVHPDGLISLNVDGTPNTKSTMTKDWGFPIECEEGWAMIKPSQDRLGTIPLEVAINGIEGIELENINKVISD